ncbi:hypothetical protein TRFO_11696 [Tritrichomonas foetus]|uniref:Protein kinase domain-containing protein n=1 Tax=Tritrichomonas foetus TaxID=1144522 RepID=A0A1J4J5T0_9EUKA|nr:hypothetical protein TRFO_11696 [Tritrichomonas foetus]|eukprot:OHS93503.1 hypothetical protein TRFO_11696 [Tritrichomonas foetus]
MNRETGIDRVAFNRVIYQIQNSTIYCIEDEDLTLLFSYWKYDYLRSFATENELKAVRSELSHHLDDRFAQYGVELNDSMTNSTFLFLTKEVSSVYYDLAPKPGVKVYNLDNVLNLWASHCLAEKTTFVNPEEGDSITNSEEPCLEIFNKDFDIHTSFQPNVVQEIEVLPNFKVNCLISTADDETVCKYISSLKTGKVSSIHFSNSPNCLTSYFSFCTGTDLIVLTNPTVVQMSAVVRKLASTFVVPCTQGDVTHLFFYDYLNKVSKLTERTQIVSVVEEIKNASNAIYTRPFIYDTTLTVSRFMNICQSTVLGYYIRSQYLVKAAAPSSFNKFSLSGFIFLRRITYNVGLYLQRSTGKLFAIKNFDSVFQFNQSVYAYKNKHMSCLIPCYGSIQENEHNYLVFAFASRGTLQDVLADHYLNLALSRKITIQLVFAIAYLHLTGMYPCNLRAENVVISWDYDVYLINFDEYQRALHRAPAQFDLYNLSSILYTLVSYEQATSLSTLTNNFGIITQLFELCRRSDATVSDLVSLILSSTRNLKNEEELINRLSDELPTRGHIIDVVPDELSLRYFKANCDCPSIVPFLKALRLGDCVAFHFVDENNTFVFASHTVCGTLTNASPEAINALLKKMEYTFIVPVQESDLRKLFTYFYFDILRSFCRGDELENVRSRIPSTIEQMNNFEDKNIIASTLAAFFTATHPEAVPLAINEPEESSKLAPSPLAPSPLEPMEQLQPVQMEPSPPSSPRNVSLLNPRFSIHNQINYDVPCIVEVFNDFYVKALFSSGDNQALRDFVQELGCDQVATVLFHKEYVCFVTVNHLLVINRFENVAINRVLYQIQNSIVYCIGEEDRSTLFNYWKFDLLKHFASEENLQRLRNDVAAESKALFTISLTADQTIIKSMTFSTLFYMAQDAVVAYYLIHCPDHELPNPRARAVPQQPQDASQTLDGTSFQTFLGVTDNTDVKKAFELYTQAAAKHDPAALFNLGLMYSRGEGIPKDKTRAAEYYTQAAALGNAKAQFNLGLMYAKGDGIAQNKAKAVELYTQAADQGSAKAQSNLGLMYSKGDGVDVDYDKAVELYTKAAEQGDADAQLNLGLMYDQGEGVPVNKARAVELYTQAADKGNAKAQFNLGVMYHKGEEGVPKDNEKAVELYSMAAAKGIAQAQFNLGVMYSKGDKNVPVNKEKAVQLFTMAAKQGDPDAQLNLGAMYAKGDGVEQNKEKTIELYTQAAEKGSAKAQFNLGVMYSKGDGVQQDKAKAVEYYEQAAKQRIPQAQFNLGVMYFKGDGIQKDKPRAAELFEEAANRGNSKALFNLAVMNQKGDGIPENKERALELYEKSAKFNNVDALLNLGVMYGEGEGCQKDKAKAIEYYTRAAELGNAKAQLNLGLMYHNGDGCEQDCEKARYYYEKAAAQGNAQAQLNLGLMYAVVNRERATQLLEKSADQGNADALLSLGNMYSGSDANKSRAVECYAAAAAQGNPEAQCKLGAMYLHGDGVEQDLDKAEQLLLESVTGGDFDEALLHLGDLYEMRGDSQRAADYFRRAAERGVPDAESRLSQQKSPMSKLFEDLDSRIRVIHTRHIDPTSEEYGDFKATLRNIEGIINIPTQHETKKGLSDCINVYTVANNVIKTTECNIDSFLRDETLRLEQQQGSRLPSLKRTGSGSVAQSHSNSSLGSLNNEPIEDEELSRLRYEVEALESQLSQLNQQILNSRQPRGINATGSNSSGLNVQVHQPTESPRRNSPRVSPREPRTPTSPGSRCPPSPRSARTKIKSLTRKAEEGDTQAQYALGACYALGEGVQVDKEKAFEFYKQAAESGNVNAQFAVAACYSYGKGTEVDKEKAFEFYKLAAEQGHAKAQFALGHFYAYGQGVEPDQDKAVEWYGKAADQGHYAAKKALDEDLLQDYDSNE